MEYERCREHIRQQSDLIQRCTERTCVRRFDHDNELSFWIARVNLAALERHNHGFTCARRSGRACTSTLAISAPGGVTSASGSAMRPEINERRSKVGWVRGMIDILQRGGGPGGPAMI